MHFRVTDTLQIVQYPTFTMKPTYTYAMILRHYLYQVEDHDSVVIISTSHWTGPEKKRTGHNLDFVFLAPLIEIGYNPHPTHT